MVAVVALQLTGVPHVLRDSPLATVRVLNQLCRYHHHNFLTPGWQVTLNADGIPEWTPPRWIDPNQKPLVNTRIQANLIGRQTRQTRAP